MGGDFYDFIEWPEAPGRLNVVIGDVTGKGVAAALMMTSVRAVLRASSAAALRPSVVLERTNREIGRDGRGGLLVTALYATLDVAMGRVDLASAGHDPPVLGRAGRSRLTTTNGFLLGMFRELALDYRRLDLVPGDLLVLYTDGVTEARDARGRLFGERRLRRTLHDCGDANAGTVAQAVLAAARDFAGGVAPSDDLTLVVIGRTEPGSGPALRSVRPRQRGEKEVRQLKDIPDRGLAARQPVVPEIPS